MTRLRTYIDINKPLAPVSTATAPKPAFSAAPAMGLAAILGMATLGCSAQSEPLAPPAPPEAESKPAVTPEAPPEAAPTAEPPTADELGVRIIADAGFATPESVVHDPAQDVYFVSNINGAPTEADGNGFVSKLTPDGDVTARFIDGDIDGVELNAPKGLAVEDGVLYVCDIDHVRFFDAKTGAPKGSVQAPGATFLNAIKAAGDGTFIVSDSGLAPDFSSSGTDAIYRLKNNKLTKIVANKKLTAPNGVLPTAEGTTWVVTFGGKELYEVGRWGRVGKVQTLPGGALDGIQRLRDGRLAISSWETSSIYVGKEGGEFVELITGVESPADIGYDQTRNRLLIPLFKKDTVIFHTIAEPVAEGETPTDKALSADSAAQK